MIVVIVRQREISDFSWRIADGSELWQQRSSYGEGSLRRRRAIGVEGTVRDLAGIPHERPARMFDQETGREHLGFEFPVPEPELSRCDTRDFATIEHVQTHRLRRV